ncbi:hypothetical protein IW261DRAFT_1518711, partial [Armillaria novae-zelandiae]
STVSSVPARLAFLVSLSFAHLLLAALVHAPSRSFKTTLMALKRQLCPRQGPASDAGARKPTSGNSAQVSCTDGNGAASSNTSAAGSGGAGSLTSPTSDAVGSTSSSTIDTTTSSTSSSTAISTSSTLMSTFSTTSAPRSTMSSTLTVTSTSSILPSTKTSSVRCHHTTILTTYTTNMPISVASSDSGSSANVNRTALIAGVTTAAVVLAALALGAVFIYKRAQKRHMGFMETIKCIRWEGKGAGAVGLLDDEFEDTTHQRYRDLPNTPVSIPRSMHALSPPPSEPSNYSTASLVRGDSGSMFREEVWPPPHNASGHSREPSIEDDPFRWRGGGTND